jgi:subfamily B ATP-binding cassette protein MsbA
MRCTKNIRITITFLRKRKGDVIAEFADVNEVQTFLSILELIVKNLTIIFTIIAMLTISVNLTLFVFIFIPVSGYVISLIGKQLKKQSTKAQEEQGSFIYNRGHLVALKVVKGYNLKAISTLFSRIYTTFF